MKIKIENSYHNTTELVEAESLEEAKKNHLEGLQVTAGNLAENEVEEDWADYYETYEEALHWTYESIYDQLRGEVTFSVVNEPMTIREVINQLQGLEDEKKDLPFYVCDSEGNNSPIYSISLYDSYAPHTKENPFGANY